MSVTNEILQLLSVLVLVLWLVSASFIITKIKDMRTIYPFFAPFTTATFIFTIVANFHLHNLVLATIMSGAFVLLTGYWLWVELWHSDAYQS